jgi:hypothetical protein
MGQIVAQAGTGSVSGLQIRSLARLARQKSEPGAVATGQGVNVKGHYAGNSERLIKKLSIWPVATAPGSDFAFANSIDLSRPFNIENDRLPHKRYSLTFVESET